MLDIVFSSPILSNKVCQAPSQLSFLSSHREQGKGSFVNGRTDTAEHFLPFVEKLCNHLGISKRLASSHVIKSVIDHKADFPHSAYKRQSPITQSSLASVLILLIYLSNRANLKKWSKTLNLMKNSKRSYVTVILYLQTVSNGEIFIFFLDRSR